MKYAFHVVDVFSSTPFGGNQLANPGVALTWWDEAAWAERLGCAQQAARLSAGVFRALRESNLRLWASVPRARRAAG